MIIPIHGNRANILQFHRMHAVRNLSGLYCITCAMKFVHAEDFCECATARQVLRMKVMCIEMCRIQSVDVDVNVCVRVPNVK